MQMEAYKAVPATNETYTVLPKETEADDKYPTYVTLADAAKYLGIASSVLQKNLAGKVYRGEVRNTIYGEIDHQIAVTNGTAYLDGKNKNVIYVSLEYIEMRRAVRNRAPKVEIVRTYEVQKAFEDDTLDSMLDKYVTQYDARDVFWNSGRSIYDLEEFYAFPLDPHSTQVVPVSIIIEEMRKMPRHKETAGAYVWKLLNQRKVSDDSHIFVTDLFAVGLIEESLMRSAKVSEMSELKGSHTVIRPSHLAVLAGGVHELRRQVLESYASDKYTEKFIPKLVRDRMDALDHMRKAFGPLNEQVAALLRVEKAIYDDEPPCLPRV